MGNESKLACELRHTKREPVQCTGFHMKKIVCIESEMNHCLLGGTLLSVKQGVLTKMSGMKKVL